MAPLQPEERQKQLISAAGYAVHAVGLTLALYSASLYWKQDYHTSRLSGAEWVDELIRGHPDRIWTELGMRLHVFLALDHELRFLGMKDGQTVGVNEQVAIFLYMCVTGLSVRHVGERFQQANGTISKYSSFFYIAMDSNSVRYFIQTLSILSVGRFYMKCVCLPWIDDPPPDFIWRNPKFWPFFSNAIGAMDGTHINCCPSAAEHQAARNRKGGISQNCLACVYTTVELKRWEKTNPDSIKNRCNLHWFSIKFQPFVVELMPLKTPLWDEISNLILQVKVGKKHPLMLD